MLKLSQPKKEKQKRIKFKALDKHMGAKCLIECLAFVLSVLVNGVHAFSFAKVHNDRPANPSTQLSDEKFQKFR